ncbi:hypothetical protein F4778DRAFT_469199 [Xylariomycetidae sp. FL2044]|nr:hypothetical protein F4778DRAFT_469199 [Xylariomycetidae sp. FL2044]
MQKRRSHKKSRKGCINCKKWHVKCDEQGPPCTNCVLRKATCKYPYDASSRAGGSVGGGAAGYGSSSSSALPSSSAIAASRNSPGLTPDGFEARRLLELRLMHQWATSTYKTMCSIPEDVHYLQEVMPREALGHDYLLNGILAVSALHLAIHHRPDARARRQYLNLAMELYDRGSGSFRTHLGHVTPDNIHILYMFSALTTYTNVAFLQCAYRGGHDDNNNDDGDDSQSTLEHMAVAFDLLNGGLSIVSMGMDWLMDSPVPIRAMLALGQASLDLIDPETHAALARLDDINDSIYGCTTSSSPPSSSTPSSSASSSSSSSSSPLSPPPPPSPSSSSSSSSSSPRDPPTPTPQHQLYRRAIDWLRRCYAEDARALLRGYCCTFPSAAGRGFAAALKAAEPLALLVTMHWAVLLDRLPAEYWWADDIGRRLALEIADVLLLRGQARGRGSRRMNYFIYPGGGGGGGAGGGVDYSRLPGWREAMAWVGDRIGGGGGAMMTGFSSSSFSSSGTIGTTPTPMPVGSSIGGLPGPGPGPNPLFLDPSLR